MTTPLLTVLILQALIGLGWIFREPGNGTPVKVDCSQPVKTLQTLSHAIQAEDANAFAACFLRGTEEASDEAAFLAEDILREHHFIRVLNAKFGKGAEEAFGEEAAMDRLLEEWANKITPADFTIKEDRAVYAGKLELPASLASFRKHGDSWLIDQSANEHLSPPTEADLEQIAQEAQKEKNPLAGMLELADFFAVEVETGHFQSAQEVKTALEEAAKAWRTAWDRLIPSRAEHAQIQSLDQFAAALGAAREAARQTFHSLAQGRETSK